MKAGDLVMYCDGFTDPEPVLIIEIATGDLLINNAGFGNAIVLNELGEHIVSLSNLVQMSDWYE